MKLPHAMRYNGSMKSATMRGDLPHLRFGKSESLAVLRDASDGLHAPSGGSRHHTEDLQRSTAQPVQEAMAQF
jgi:hypothetical protein